MTIFLVSGAHNEWTSTTPLSDSITRRPVVGLVWRAFSMGGMGGHCRGKTKLECYKNFRREVNRKRIEDATGLYMDAGTGTKQELYASMKKDPGTGEWVLYYHFRK